MHEIKRRILFIAALVSCASVSPPASPEPANCLPDDSKVPVLKTAAGLAFVRTPDSQFEGLAGFPFAPHYVEVGGGLRMHYVDEGPADGELGCSCTGNRAGHTCIAR